MAENTKEEIMKTVYPQWFLTQPPDRNFKYINRTTGQMCIVLNWFHKTENKYHIPEKFHIVTNL